MSWTKLSDKKPSQYGVYLAYSSIDDDIVIAAYYPLTGWAPLGEDRTFKTTHWMSLPDKPEVN